MIADETAVAAANLGVLPGARGARRCPRWTLVWSHAEIGELRASRAGTGSTAGRRSAGRGRTSSRAPGPGPSRARTSASRSAGDIGLGRLRRGHAPVRRRRDEDEPRPHAGDEHLRPGRRRVEAAPPPRLRVAGRTGEDEEEQTIERRTDAVSCRAATVQRASVSPSVSDDRVVRAKAAVGSCQLVCCDYFSPSTRRAR